MIKFNFSYSFCFRAGQLRSSLTSLTRSVSGRGSYDQVYLLSLVLFQGGAAMIKFNFSNSFCFRAGQL